MHLQIKSYSKLPNEAFSGAKFVLLKQRFKSWLKVETIIVAFNNLDLLLVQRNIHYSRANHTLGVIGVKTP